MADSKITALTALTAADPVNDMFPIVDVSDTTMAASGTTKKISVNNILSSSPTASGALTVTGLVTAGSATITGDLTAARWLITGGSLPGVGNGNPFAYRIGGGGLGIGAATETGTTAPIVFYCGQGGVEQYRIAPLGVNTWSDGAGGTRMTLNSTGLGVGASPNQPIQLSKSNTSTALTAPPTGGASLRIQNTSSTNNNFGSVEFYNAAGLFGASINCQYTNQATPTNDLVFVVRGSGGGIEAARIDSSGNVGIGVTPSAWGAGLKALQVGATGYGALFDFNNDVIAMSANLLWTGSAYNRISASSKYALAYYQDIGGSHQWSMSSAAGTNAVAPTMNTLMTLNANGNLVLKGGTAAANGVGVTFPATQVASSDANTLDDYEEGTFTPTVIGSTLAGVGTYTQQKGFYTKVGRLVTVNVWLQWTAHTGTGNMSFSGLPFTVQNTSGNYGGISIGYVSNIALTAGNVIYGLTEFGTTNVTVAQSPTGGGTYSLVPMDISAEISFTATYIV